MLVKILLRLYLDVVLVLGLHDEVFAVLVQSDGAFVNKLELLSSQEGLLIFSLSLNDPRENKVLDCAHVCFKMFQSGFLLLSAGLRIFGDTHVLPQLSENDVLVEGALLVEEAHLQHNVESALVVDFGGVFQLVESLDLPEIALESLVNDVFRVRADSLQFWRVQILMRL